MTVAIPTDIDTSILRASWRMTGIVSLALMMFPFVLLIWLLRMDRVRAKLVLFFYRGVRILCGVRLRVEGAISSDRPLMLVANHTSYLDILVLGSILPLSFTPKKEIRSWPIIGFFCVLADCIFIERKPADMQRAQAEMAERLNRKKAIALFPEGTTGDGFHIKPFKSGFLNLVETHDLPLQSVSLAYTHIGGLPLSATTRELVAWIGEADLVTHLSRLLSFPYTEVTATFYPAVKLADYADRKALAKAAEQTITTGLHSVLEQNGVLN